MDRNIFYHIVFPMVKEMIDIDRSNVIKFHVNRYKNYSYVIREIYPKYYLHEIRISEKAEREGLADTCFEDV